MRTIDESWRNTPSFVLDRILSGSHILVSSTFLEHKLRLKFSNFVEFARATSICGVTTEV